jgi:hypothetical protein
METYWCTQKNLIIDMMNGKKISLALSPCLKAECDVWNGGECIHIRKAGKPDRPQFFSR